MTRDRDPLTPALAGSAALHLAVAALFLISWPWSRELKIGTAVPVNIVTNAPSTDLRPAVEAPEEQAAATETPEPDASLEAPAPPTPEPLPAPTPTPAAPKPPPPKPAEKPAEKAPATKPEPRKEVDLDKLLASVTKGGKSSSAPKGPTRPETATQARPAAGTGLSANQLRGLADELQRRWNPNCDVEGGRDVQVKVSFNLGFGGQVVGEVAAGGAERSSNAVVQAAADRAIRAVYAASPFRNLSRDFYGQRITVNFNAREACS